MNCFLRLHFRGGLDRPALEAAAQGLFARHPLLMAVVRPAGRNRWQWEPVAAALPAVRWLDGPVGQGLPRVGPIDIRRESGLRLWAVGDRDRTDVTVQLHHVACDGIAIVGFVEELLRRYAERIGVTGLPPLPPSRPEKLRGRGRFGLNAWRLLRILGRQAVGLIGVWHFAVAPPGAGGGAEVSPQAARPLPSVYPATLSHEFAAEETIGAAPSRQGVGGAFERPAGPRPVSGLRRLGAGRHPPAKGRDWLRLTVPMSLRSPADFDMPAANVVSMVFLDRRSAEMADGRGAVAAASTPR